MSKEAFTPGPWGIGSKIVESTSQVIAIYEEKNRRAASAGYLADVYAGYVGSQDISFEEGAANANLIAVAPELYEALKECLDLIELMLPNEETIISESRASLAKARGES